MRVSCLNAAAVLLMMASPASAQTADCTNLKAVVAAAIKIDPRATPPDPFTIPLDGTDCEVRYGMPKCMWFTDQSGHANADVLYQSMLAKVSACFPGSEVSDNNGMDEDVGKKFTLDNGQTVDVTEYKSGGGVMLSVMHAM